MRLQSMVLRVMIGAGLVLGLTSAAEAQATRTWVSGVGDDANPCSRTAPCKTFAGAISKTATNGYINVLDPGGFGAVTITKSITIDGGPFHAGIVVGASGNAIVINNATAKVVLRNIDLEGAAVGNHGINVVSVGALHVEHLNIVNFVGNGINFNPSGAGGLLFVDDTTFKQTQGLIANNGRITVENTVWEGNSKGIFAGANALVMVRNSIVSGGGEGFAALAASTIINVENCVVSNNQFGLDAQGGSTIRVSNTGIFSNTTQGIFNDGSSFVVSLGGNSLQGNLAPGAFTSTLAKQ